MTTTLIERLPCNWDSDDNFGDAWGDISPGSIWSEIFCRWIEYRYADAKIHVCGNEIIGPATYVYPNASVQRGTPSLEELPDLPDSLYGEFNEGWVGDSWCDLIIHWNSGGIVDFNAASAKESIQTEPQKG